MDEQSIVNRIYILLSIKTRIETANKQVPVSEEVSFISYYPLKQGLKLMPRARLASISLNLYPTIH